MAKRRKFSKAERQLIYSKLNGHCAYCGCEISLDSMQIDHIISIKLEAHAVNGQDLNVYDNLLPACRSCNHYKSTLTIEKFRSALERMPDVLMRDSVTYRNAVRFGLVKPASHPVAFYFERYGQQKEAANYDGNDN